jgi:hypothetical protein
VLVTADENQNQRKAASFFGKEVEEIPLRHKRHELADARVFGHDPRGIVPILAIRRAASFNRSPAAPAAFCFVSELTLTDLLCVKFQPVNEWHNSYRNSG